ncbi:MAG TPA: NADP-dependent malic enzyme [Methanospirillum sp.]|nr:NADP-dependent malic enzyme [Methanospirillum sp.]
MNTDERTAIGQEALELHAANKGKLSVCSKVPLSTRQDLSRAYTPGVAEVCREIARDQSLTRTYTLKANSVAIISDGTAVLGLGNIGPYAAIPVMEGKAILFKEFAGIDAYPICLDAERDDIVRIIRGISPVFGGINLEDIAAPYCFEIEEELQDLGIPVMHDDQHGAAVAVLAGLINSCRVTGKEMNDLRVVVCGAGAAGYAICRLLKCIGYDTRSCIPVKELIVCDTEGIIYRGRPGLYHNKYKFILAEETNKSERSGSLADAMVDADVFIGVSVAGIVTQEMVRTMAPDPIVFALANPVPEIMPGLAHDAGAAIVGTGRSDYPNQVNNVLVFPGIFRGALDAGAMQITDEMKIAAAHAIASFVRKPTYDCILPDPLNREVARVVAEAVRKASIPVDTEKF